MKKVKEEFRPLLEKLSLVRWPVVGIGVTAFNRCAPGFFLPDYRMVCQKNSADLAVIEKKMKVVCVERDFPREKARRYNSLSILKSRGVKRYLKRLAEENRGRLGVFVYKSSRNIERICDYYGWRIVGNRAKVRDRWENKKFFREALEKVGIEPIPAERFSVEEVNWEKVVEVRKRLGGRRVVMRLPEVTRGGGQGTVFVETKEDFEKFERVLAERRKKFELKNVFIAKFIRGESPSMTGCVTRYGVLCGPLQTQVLDQSLLVDREKGSGLFCGHDWSFGWWPEQVWRQAARVVRRFGEFIYKKGYLGVFGIDFLVEENGRVWPVECNPRYTGAFPVFSMLQMEAGEPSFDVFHLLEHLGVDYEVDLEAVQRLYWRRKEGAHLVLSNRTNRRLRVKGQVRAGVWRFEKGRIEFVREGFEVGDIKDPEREFVLTDGVPLKGGVVRPRLRCGKMVFKRRVLETRQRLFAEVAEMVRQVYERMGLEFRI